VCGSLRRVVFLVSVLLAYHAGGRPGSSLSYAQLLHVEWFILEFHI